MGAGEFRWEQVKGFQAHDSSVLFAYSWENLLYTTVFKGMKIWDLEA
jgi:hypothetical protein